MSFFSHSLREGGVSLCVVKKFLSISCSSLCFESRTTAFLLFSSCTLLAFSVPPPFTHRSHIAHTSLTHRSHICTHLALILHSSVTHRKKKKNEEEKYSPHTPYKKKKIKEEENPIFFLTSEYWGARDIFQRISAKAKGLLAKSWSSRTSRTGQTGRTGRTGPISPTCLTKKLIRSHLAAYCSRGCSEASVCRKARCSRVSRQ